MSDLACNNMECRSPLSSEAFITSCSHAFCGNCIQQVSSNCPACSNEIINLHKEIVKVKLPPTPDWKARVLVGLNPADILESARSGLTFYMYQLEQNLSFSQSLIKHLNQRLDDQESKQSLVKFEQDLKIKSLEKKVSDLYDELAIANEGILVEQRSHKDTKSQLGRLQTLYDATKQNQFYMIRSRSMSANSLSPALASSSLNESSSRPPYHQHLQRIHHPSPLVSPDLQHASSAGVGLGLQPREFSFRRQ